MKRTTRAKKVPKVDAETAEIISIQLDVSTGSVRRGSDVVALRAKTLAVLQHLMERAGSIVGREELREKVWGKRHGNVDGPKQCVREIRAALHDVTKPPRFIETVGRRGYRFIGDLEVVGAEKNQDSPGLIPSATVRPTCVGREQELDGLANWLARARRGGRAICFLAGEPGAGKTTLVDHFLSNIADRNAIWIARGQCVPNYGVHETYGPLFDAIEHLALDPARCDFVQLIRQHAPTWLAQLPSVFHAREVSEKREELTGSGPGRMLRELTDMTHLAPGIIVLEDLHWSDSATLGWICAWALRRAPAPLMIFGTYRSDEADCNVARIAPVLGDCERRRPAVFGGRARFRSGRRWSGLANLFSSGASDLFAFAPQSHIPDTGNAAPEHFSLPIMASLAYTSGAQLTNWSVLPSFSGLSSGGPVDSHSAVYIEQSLLVC